MPIENKWLAECFGTFWLVFAGCGSGIVASGYPQMGFAYAGVALCFGLTVVTMGYAVGHISGGHFNPAVTLGRWAGGRFPGHHVLAYWSAQLVGAILAAIMLYVIASGRAGWALDGSNFATNGFGPHSPGHYSFGACLTYEVLLTAFFIFVIMGATDDRAPKGFAPFACGLCLTLITLISMPVTGTSTNPARSTGVALIEGGIALHQLWAFWVAPLFGGVLGGVSYRFLVDHR